MATTTPNFGWSVPTSTDLVKDGATAIETLGDSIDASLVDLKGGTTGQILAKASATDMDFNWITNDVGDITAVTAGTGISGGGTSGAVTITNSMATEITAKGDLIVGTGSATFDNLTAGNNGETIVADSSTSTGLRYTAGTVSDNPILNSSFQVWQRGTSVAIAANTNGYTTDRWTLNASGANLASTVSRQATGDTTNLPNIQYCARVQRNAGQTGTSLLQFVQSFESVNSIPFAGKAVTFSFYARAGANYSPTSGGLAFILLSGTGTDQSRATTAYTGETFVIISSVALTSTWQRVTATGTIPTTATEIATYFAMTPTGTAGANDYFEITGVQIDIGSVALPFRTYAGTIQGELAACQRYYYRIFPNDTSRSFGTTYANAATGAISDIPFPVTMRTRPTALEQSGTAADYSVVIANASTACSAVPSYGTVTNQSFAGVSYTVASGLTNGQAGRVVSASANAYLGWSAEL